MADNAQLELSLWERFNQWMNRFSEGVGSLLLGVFGSRNERFVKSLGYKRVNRAGAVHDVIVGSFLAKINALEPSMNAKSNDELALTTTQLREKRSAGASIESLLPEAFAAVREAGKRSKGMRHYDTQLVGGIVLHRGKIAEMVTGEGKTLVATLPAFLNALDGKGVHVITVNDYLARRDCEWMLPIFRTLGMEAGFIQSDMDSAARRSAYECDITYGTNSEFGFDYLRDNMKPARWGDPAYPSHSHQSQRGLNFAVIDEVDNILIDEARTPLIISGPSSSDRTRFAKADEIARKLTDLERTARIERLRELREIAHSKGETIVDPALLHAESTQGGGLPPLPLPKPGEDTLQGVHFEIKEKEHSVHLTDRGTREAENIAGVESFYTAGNMEWPHLIDNALKAHHLYRRDKQYAVMDHPETGEKCVIIIDEFTGRLMIGRQWSDGLHQAVEAKHVRDGVQIKEETQTLATITLQNFFKLYSKLAGMTGTAMTEADEFWKIYKLDVVAIPTNRPLVRREYNDIIFRTEKEKWKAVLDEVGEIHKQGRPVLIGTTDVAKSAKLSQLLKQKGIKHELLNALPEHAAREAEIVAQAGRIGAVTISTNMAGRGTDIILGGNPETLAWARLKDKYPTRLEVPEEVWKQFVGDIETKEQMKEQGRKVAENGGLHVVGTERHDSRRVDNQLRGRAGRQGDPGSSRFYLSLQDDLLRVFNGEWASSIMGRLGIPENEPIEGKLVNWQIQKSQKKVEERHFETRKNLLEYDEVMDMQRRRVYSYRQAVLNDTNCRLLILDMLDKQGANVASMFLKPDYGFECYAKYASERLGIEFSGKDFRGCNAEAAEDTARTRAKTLCFDHVNDLVEENLGGEEESEYNWQALSLMLKRRYDLEIGEASLKKIGKDLLLDELLPMAEAAIEKVDLSQGGQFLEKNFAAATLCNWVGLSYRLKVDQETFFELSMDGASKILKEGLRTLYRTKDVEFPVNAGMAQFLPTSGQSRREELAHWAQVRFPRGAADLNIELVLTESAEKVRDELLRVSEANLPPLHPDAVDKRILEILAGAKTPEPSDGNELEELARDGLALEITAEQFMGRPAEAIRQLLLNEFDNAYRPEMKTMERHLVLMQLDSAWKNHLYAMDQLRSAVGLRGYAQEDPKIVYKREGMREFETMWAGVIERTSELVFRMEEAEGYEESIWVINTTRHEDSPSIYSQAAAEQAAVAAANAKNQGREPLPGQNTPPKVETVRNFGIKVGRNDPCPCGSGKKHKNCCMKQHA